MALGDQIQVWRKGVYAHCGIDIGDGTVIHLTGDLKEKPGVSVKHTFIEDFRRDGVIEVIEPSDSLSSLVVVMRAIGQIGRTGYNLLDNNCEHFASWCKTGKSRSVQVNILTIALLAIGIGGLLLLTSKS